MKHNFLLDENILYHAVRGVDEHENPDHTATELLFLIAKNCHRITLSTELLPRYWHHLKRLVREPAPALQPVYFMTQFIKNSAKAAVEYSNPPELPAEVRIPAEDVHVVRAAMMVNAVVVTADGELREAINSQPALQLRALNPAEAIELAKEE